MRRFKVLGFILLFLLLLCFSFTFLTGQQNIENKIEIPPPSQLVPNGL